MKATELRIGNYYSIRDKNGVNIKQVVYLIPSNGEWFSDGDNLNLFADSIPLTEEWLLKFGFKFKIDGEEVYEQMWRLNEFELWQHSDGFCHDFHMGGDINYVHQLQNLYFALTGEELIVSSNRNITI